MGKISDYIKNNRGYLRGHTYVQMATHSSFGTLIFCTVGTMPHVQLGVVGISAGFACYLTVSERKDKQKKLVEMAKSEKVKLRTNRDSLGYQILSQYLWIVDDPEFTGEEDVLSRPCIEMKNLTRFQAEEIDIFMLKAGEEDQKSGWLKDTLGVERWSSYESFPELHEYAAGIACKIGYLQGRNHVVA